MPTSTYLWKDGGEGPLMPMEDRLVSSPPVAICGRGCSLARMKDVRQAQTHQHCTHGTQHIDKP
eukprot:1159080-Pelagomonas_calceolata.AAC.6